MKDRFCMVYLKGEPPIYATVKHDEDLLEPLTATPDFVRIKAGNGKAWIVEKVKILKIRITDSRKPNMSETHDEEETVVVGGNVPL